MYTYLQTNTFQAVLVTSGRQSFAIFNYLDNGINWSKGDSSIVPAQVGFNYGGIELNTFTVPGSRMPNITEIDTVSNMNNPGQFVFQIDDFVHPSASGCNSTSGMYTNNMYMYNCLYACACILMLFRNVQTSIIIMSDSW